MLNRQLLLLGGGSKNFGRQVKERFDGGAAFTQTTGIGRVLEIAMIGFGIPTLLPLGGRREQDHSLLCPATDTRGVGITIIRSECGGL